MTKRKDVTWREILKALDPIRRKSTLYSAGVTHSITNALERIAKGDFPNATIAEREDALAILERIKQESEDGAG